MLDFNYLDSENVKYYDYSVAPGHEDHRVPATSFAEMAKDYKFKLIAHFKDFIIFSFSDEVQEDIYFGFLDENGRIETIITFHQTEDNRVSTILELFNFIGTYVQCSINRRGFFADNQPIIEHLGKIRRAASLPQELKDPTEESFRNRRSFVRQGTGNDAINYQLFTILSFKFLKNKDTKAGQLPFPEIDLSIEFESTNGFMRTNTVIRIDFVEKHLSIPTVLELINGNLNTILAVTGYDFEEMATKKVVVV